jgi:hypothetical protein
MDERETLIRVEQQLQDSIKNQSLILNDLKEIFNKIEIESKATAVVKSDLNTHLETTIVRREDNDRRFRALEEKQKEIISILSQFQSDFTSDVSDLKDSFLQLLEEERKKRVEDTNESKIFQKQITTSINMLKWIIGFLFLVISTVWPILTFIFEKKP